jgi:hypothetical protein
MARRKAVQSGNAVTTQSASWKSLLGAVAFGRGFKEVHAGLPFNSDAIESRWHWHYERGRLFGVVYKGQLKEGRTVLRAAIYAAQIAYRDKVFT